MYKRYAWIAPGDVNTFFGLMLDNIGVLVLSVTLLAAKFGFPASFALRYMVPGTALGVLVGDVAFTILAFWVARRTGRSDVTAMPLGIDTPSTFGMVFFVLGPAFLEARAAGLDEQAAARLTWHLVIRTRRSVPLDYHICDEATEHSTDDGSNQQIHADNQKNSHYKIPHRRWLW